MATPQHVTTLALRESGRLPVLTAKNRVTGLRSLLRSLRHVFARS